MPTKESFQAREIDGAPLFDGILKQMMWQPDTNTIYLNLHDEREGKHYMHVLADNGRANELFAHPFRFISDGDLVRVDPKVIEQVESD